jgi:hypothetical protein
VLGSAKCLIHYSWGSTTFTPWCCPGALSFRLNGTPADTSGVNIYDTIFDRAIENAQVAPDIRQHASDVLAKDEEEE